MVERQYPFLKVNLGLRNDTPRIEMPHQDLINRFCTPMPLESSMSITIPLNLDFLHHLAQGLTPLILINLTRRVLQLRKDGTLGTRLNQMMVTVSALYHFDSVHYTRLIYLSVTASNIYYYLLGNDYGLIYSTRLSLQAGSIGSIPSFSSLSCN